MSDLKEEYHEETNLNAELPFGDYGMYRDSYVEWLEKKLANEPTTSNETALNIDLVSLSFNTGDEIMVCDELITQVTKIEDEKIYFLDEDKIERWEIASVIKHYSS